MMTIVCVAGVVDHCIKDLTKKYASHWLTCVRKLRISDEWWQSLLARYRTKDTDQDQLENTLIHG